MPPKALLFRQNPDKDRTYQEIAQEALQNLVYSLHAQLGLKEPIFDEPSSSEKDL